MSFNITLYKMLDEKIKVKKTLGNGVTFTGTLREECDIINPSILMNAAVNEICGYNYAYIPEFKRYYFINSTGSYRNNLSVINLTVDVLTTYQSSILNAPAIITRTSKNTTGYFALPDDRFPVKQSDETHVITFPDLYTNGSDVTKAQTMVLVLTGVTTSS